MRQPGCSIMPRIRCLTCIAWALVSLSQTTRGENTEGPRVDEAPRVYGEWRIRVRPDQGPAYDRLIEQSGLPLFREAGGRMVGWWKTLIGDLYEHVTIWEYDNMAGFENAIGILSKSPAFARFVAARDPLLAGEENRFLRLVSGAESPRLAEPAPFVVHEIHRVPLARRDAYLAFMTGRGLELLKSHGFRPVGPFVVEVGRWSELTYLFRFDSLAERERLIREFATKPDARAYLDKIGELSSEITTRMLIPAPFSRATPPEASTPKGVSAAPLPHRQQVAPGVYAAGSSDRHRSANFGWVASREETLLIDLPRGQGVADCLALIAATTGKPARTLLLTNYVEGDLPILRSLLDQGVSRVLTSSGVRSRLIQSGADATAILALPDHSTIGSDSLPVDFLSLDHLATEGGGAVHLPASGVLFAGPLVVHGPRTPLPGSDTERWVAALRRLEALSPARVVPGFGSWGGPELLSRQRRFLAEMRRLIGYHIAQGRSLADLGEHLQLSTDYLVCMPYDNPITADLEHVYNELTVPFAPFHGRAPALDDSRRHALVLIGDQPHEPGHLEDGLRPVFEATGVVPHFTVDVRALSADNLAKVQLLVILRDGLQRPQRDAKANYVWMTPEQEHAVVTFVESGGGFLNLHNSMGIYPDGGPYLQLVGGRYIGHGPLERFRVEVVDGDHPVTRGVSAYFVADEQHTPPYDEHLVHPLLRNRSDDGKEAAAGWVREAGRGRLCHLANGHTREALQHPMFQTLLRNAVRWCLRHEDPIPKP
jgi:type 1 glutamine amidotransferase